LVRSVLAHIPFWCSNYEAKVGSILNLLFLLNKNIGTDSAESLDVTGSAVHGDVEKMVHALTRTTEAYLCSGQWTRSSKQPGKRAEFDDQYLAL
jgi:hypothetical protein